ncbi:hypothetical protein K438DRAFT_2026417 [Mycena galopus ATCC 62051]|nr:hypothetical protein K438DRAFT_2026417 [Mycena galopus ATCC 62051]
MVSCASSGFPPPRSKSTSARWPWPSRSLARAEQDACNGQFALTISPSRRAGRRGNTSLRVVWGVLVWKPCKTLTLTPFGVHITKMTCPAASPPCSSVIFTIHQSRAASTGDADWTSDNPKCPHFADLLHWDGLNSQTLESDLGAFSSCIDFRNNGGPSEVKHTSSAPSYLEVLATIALFFPHQGNQVGVLRHPMHIHEIVFLMRRAQCTHACAPLALAYRSLAERWRGPVSLCAAVMDLFLGGGGHNLAFSGT